MHRSLVDGGFDSVLQADDHLVVLGSHQREAFAQLVGLELAQLSLVRLGEHAPAAATLADEFHALLERFEFGFVLCEQRLGCAFDECIHGLDSLGHCRTAAVELVWHRRERGLTLGERGVGREDSRPLEAAARRARRAGCNYMSGAVGDELLDDDLC